MVSLAKEVNGSDSGPVASRLSLLYGLPSPTLPRVGGRLLERAVPQAAHWFVSAELLFRALGRRLTAFQPATGILEAGNDGFRLAPGAQEGMLLGTALKVPGV